MRVSQIASSLFFVLFQASAETPTWRTAARNLSAGDVPRAKSLAFLRAHPDLEATLLRELEGDARYLALDAITALEMKSMVEHLIDRADVDDTGFFYLTINTLTDASNVKRVAAFYRQRLRGKRGSPAERMILLESLARMNVKLAGPELAEWLDHESPEVRGAALNYARHFLIHRNDPTYQPIIDRLKDLSPRLAAQWQELRSERKGR